MPFTKVPLRTVFVIIESTMSYHGDAKPLNFLANRERYAPFLNRIVHVIVDEIPGGPGPQGWGVPNAMQNNLVSVGLAAVQKLEPLEPTDLVFYCDLDEIPTSFIFNFLRCASRPARVHR
jgi:beta-1,4-mannosyl-glycoprotein beta-1,4-N-acetylglucosaminyltransferase